MAAFGSAASAARKFNDYTHNDLMLDRLSRYAATEAADVDGIGPVAYPDYEGGRPEEAGAMHRAVLAAHRVSKERGSPFRRINTIQPAQAPVASRAAANASPSSVGGGLDSLQSSPAGSPVLGILTATPRDAASPSAEFAAGSAGVEGFPRAASPVSASAAASPSSAPDVVQNPSLAPFRVAFRAPDPAAVAVAVAAAPAMAAAAPDDAAQPSLGQRIWAFLSYYCCCKCC